MKEKTLRQKERTLKRRYFQAAVILTGITLAVGSIFGTILVVFGTDPRPYVAALPFLYAPLLLAGVAWLAWATAAPARGAG